MSQSATNRFEKQRLQKVEAIRALGLDPYGARFDDHRPIGEVRPLCPETSGEAGDAVRIAGRVMLRRKAGKLRFYDVEDATGKIQLLFSRGDLSADQWGLMSHLDLGDLIGIDGKLWRTETGEVSIYVDSFVVLCKSLAQPPEKYHGVEDIETRLRHREIDLIYTDGVRDTLLTRSRIIDSVRQTLKRNRFHEVETPVLHAVASGAAARPFTTHHNALDIDLFLRIALEIHLKRLMVGGIERVFEIGRVFRNEGIDATHNPEFTMIEIYQAYGNYESMMDLTEQIVSDAARVVLGRDESDSSPLELPWGGRGRGDDTESDAEADNESEAVTVDFTPPWPRKKYADLFAEHVGCAIDDHDRIREIAASKEIETEGRHPDVIVNDLFEEFVEDQLTGPVFVIDYPASICPLTKRKADDETVAERFELFIHGMELANAYTELNDPILQEDLFRTQLEGQAEEDSMARMDTEFISALKTGMPPAGGLGIGIDRLVMLLTNSPSIRDVIFFPLLRPKE